MVRETSIEAYRKVQLSGFVTKKSKQVHAVFCEHGPLTSAECYNKLPWMGSDQRGNIRARVHELVKQGLLKELGKRVCSITQMTVYYYDVTGADPIKLIKDTEIKCPTCKGTGKLKQGRLF